MKRDIKHHALSGAVTFAALICISLSSCSTIGPEEEPADGREGEVLDLSFGDGGGTKTTIDAVTGKLTWDVGDKIAVWYKTGDNTGQWDYPEVQAGAKISTGAGMPDGATRDLVAVYPATSASDYKFYNSSSDWSKIIYPSELDYTDPDPSKEEGLRSGNYAPTPMMAMNDARSSGLRFYHYGGLIRFRLIAVPAGTVWISFKSTKDNIAGDYAIGNPTIWDYGYPPVYNAPHPYNYYDNYGITSSEFPTSDKVLVKVSKRENGLTSESDAFYINLPVPLGAYDAFVIDALDKNRNSLTANSATYSAVTKEVNWDCERALAKNVPGYVCFNPDSPLLNPKYVSGKFSVSPSKQVYFASGNLVVTYRSNGQHEWAFEENQYDFSSGTGPGGSYEGMSNYETDGTRISHFGWATAGVKNDAGYYGYDVNHTSFQPYSVRIGEDGYDEHTYGPSYVSAINGGVWGGDIPNRLVSENTWNRDGLSTATNAVRKYCDWGVHFDENGEGSQSRTDGLWYTLSASEWNYLFLERENYALLIGRAMIHIAESGVFINGLVILPDNWERPSSCRFRSTTSSGVSADYSTNIYTSGEMGDYFDGSWAEMEQSGAVFLPTAGTRSQEYDSAFYFWGNYVHENCAYWSSSNYTGDSALCFYILSSPTSEFRKISTSAKYEGHCVRLVHD